VTFMADTNIEQLKLEFKNAVVKALTEQGNTFSGDLRPKYRERGLSDEIMDEIIRKTVIER